jgi:5-formyltetrahydrofolate cyclo-ligase
MDPVSLEAALVARGASLALPVMVAKGKPLVFRSYAHGDTVAARTWGIHEPLASALAVQPDILLVPLLAADLTGARLGYGGGFYDRTLKELRVAKSIAAVGLCYDEQIVDAVPYLHYDEFLDYLLTPTGVTKCQEA